jgi:ATP-binding cassette subfamily B protein
MDRVEEGLADAAEMTEIIMQPHDIVDPEKPESSRISKGAVEFSNVTFRYQESDDAGLFENLQLAIPAGQKIGLVGPSGSGKTTLTKLLLRFMDIENGQILVDGQNIAHIAQDDLRRSIAYVAQEPLLFHRSIYENIAYGRAEASAKEIYDAAEKAHAAEFIKDLPKTYDTMVGERGVKLSGGQRQRVAIARAMLKRAPIIVLDEATSSLDSVSEKLITGALDELMEKRTTLVIAHRLSTIRKMDRILVLHEGKIIEDGSHQQLLKQKGMYAKLWEHQSGDFIGED